MISLKTDNILPFLSQDKINAILPEIKDADSKIRQKAGLGNEFLGWLHLGSGTDKNVISSIKDVSSVVRKKKGILLCIGIGGSYLGSRAAIDFLSASGSVYFCGNNLSSDYISDILNKIEPEKEIYVNVISKSGTTIEPAISFRVIYDFMKKKYGANGLSERIICTTDRQKGALRQMAQKEGFKTFVIPDDVGGRFSVLSPVGLFPMACAGIDIARVLKGVSDMEDYIFSCDVQENIAYKYAAIRNLLYRNGKDIEILSGFHPSLHFILEWWKQLFAESEGKDGKGIFAATADFTTDLHSIGQLIQQGKRNIFETFMVVDKPSERIKIPKLDENIDGLDYIAGKDMDYVNEMAYKGTAQAHTEGGVPNMSISIPEISDYYLGQIYYFFEIAVAVSAYLLKINPFDQPGVEAYKKNMYKLLKR
ncbi:MAG: glucose-6-phosphate isomerase [Candidatus Omnitrophica bacterium]|nr:glucose-6-phosphate isomerase [Candidatus Omnitrophota bacterium]